VQIIGIDFTDRSERRTPVPSPAPPDRGRRHLRSFFHRLLPQEDLEVGRLQRVMRHRLRILDKCTIALDERLVAVGVDGLEIRERRVASDAYSGPIAAISISEVTVAQTAIYRGSGPGSCIRGRKPRPSRRRRSTARRRSPSP